MEMNVSKVKTYIGFAVKSRQIKFGVDDILTRCYGDWNKGKRKC